MERMAEYRPNNLAPATLYPNLTTAIPQVGTVIAVPMQLQQTMGAVVIVLVIVIVFATFAKEQYSDGRRPNDNDDNDDGAVGDDKTAKVGGKGGMTKVGGGTQQ